MSEKENLLESFTLHSSINFNEVKDEDKSQNSYSGLGSFKYVDEGPDLDAPESGLSGNTAKNDDDIDDDIPEDVKAKIGKKGTDDPSSITDDLEEEDDETKTPKLKKPELGKVLKDDEEDDDVIEDSDDTEYSFAPFAQLLHEQGLLDEFDPENFNDSIEELLASTEKTINKRVDEKIKEFPDVVQELVKHIQEGGNVNDFLNLQAHSESLDNLDIENDINDQKQIIYAYFKHQEYEDSEIEDLIKDYEDSGILEKRAKSAMDKYQKIVEKEKENLKLEAQKQKQAKIAKDQERIKSIESFINKSEAIGGLNINKKEKEDFHKWLTQADSKGRTGYAKALEENQLENSIAMAYMLFKKFDFGIAKAEAKTELSKEIRNKIIKKGTKKPSGIADPSISGERSDLSAFRAFLK